MINMVVSRYPASIANYFTYDFYTAVSSTKKKCIETPIGEEEGGRGGTSTRIRIRDVIERTKGQNAI